MFGSIERAGTFVVDRRKFLAGAAGFIAAGLLPERVLALAGPYSFKQGALEITVVSDGQLILPWAVVAPDAPPEELKKLLATALSGDTVAVETNLTLLKSTSDLILFDTGSGHGFQPTAGKIVESLTMAGVDPAAVTKVVFTHAHPDHIWGTVADDGKLTFPNAAYYAAEGEWNFWMDKELVNKMPKEMHPLVLGAQKHLSGVNDRLTMVKPGDDIVTGITVVDAAGHTPGHVTFQVAGGAGLMIMADTIASPYVGFPHPDWRFGFDSIPDLAIANRKKILDRAAADRIKLLGFHWPYPGVGYAERKDGAYAYLAAA
jgi:glyoxylase-like metal-dependent hydrolase (beta-lactamase superfamily II)